MKQSRAYFCLLLLSLIAVSCHKTPAVVPDPDTLSLEFSEVTLGSKADVFSVQVSANCQWSVDCTDNWLSISPKSTAYTGDCLMSIAASENKDTSSRTSTVSFAYGSEIQTLTVTQKGFDVYLDVSELSLSFGYRAAEKVIKIVSNCGWYARSDNSWIAIRPATGLVGGYDMTVTVLTNETASGRSGTVSIWNEDYDQYRTVAVTQEAQPESSATEYIDRNGVSHGPGIVLNGLVWAPVNCGYDKERYPYGQMFQWGRKTGLGLEPGTSPIWEGNNGEEDSLTFYLSSSSSKYAYDWIVTGDNSYWNLRTEEYPAKNVSFDPCPDGWRVPTAYELKSLIDNTSRQWDKNGFLFSDSQSSIFFPAGGRLNITDGQSYDRDTDGYYWSSTTTGGSSSYLYFFSENCIVNSSGSRAGGCLVRCVRE